MTTTSNFDFDELVGEELDFYGVSGQRFRLDDVIYEAIEEERGLLGSELDRVEVCADGKDTFDLPIARIVVEEDCGIYALIDLHDGHCWLRFGTEYHYNEATGESFVFEYSPKGPGD